MKKYTIRWFLCGPNWRYNEYCCYNECRYREGSLYYSSHFGRQICGPVVAHCVWALLTRCLTKILRATIKPTIYFPKWPVWVQLSRKSSQVDENLRVIFVVVVVIRFSTHKSLLFFSGTFYGVSRWQRYITNGRMLTHVSGCTGQREKSGPRIIPNSVAVAVQLSKTFNLLTIFVPYPYIVHWKKQFVKLTNT